MVDRLLRPKIFETESNNPNAEKLYRHWKITFQNFLESSIPAVTPGTEGDEPSMAVARAATAANALKRHQALINNISATIYELISESDTYESAIATLDAAYIRPTQVVYTRHQLISSKQDAGQPIDLYLQNLNRIAKTCEFRAVTAEENKNQYVRDAFIKGISSPTIRQRLLENIGELTLEQAYTQARALEQAQSQSASFDNHHGVAAVPDDGQELNATGSKTKNFGAKNRFSKKPANKTRKCNYCGNPYHDRSVCPARDDECLGCQKPGHWKNVCRSTSALGVIGGPMAFTEDTSNAPLQQFQQQSQQQQQQQPYPQQQLFQQQQQPYQHQSQQFQQQSQQYQQHDFRPPSLA